MLVPKQMQVAIDFNSSFLHTMEDNGCRQLLWFQHFHFWVTYPFKS